MNIVNSGNEFTIYGNEVKTFKKLPANTYRVCYSDHKGFFLSTHNDLEVHEKIYGSYQKKVDKVMKSFECVERNMGVILSGQKGVGKSVFARLLAEEGKKRNLPMIIIDQAVGGIDSFISSIQQECIVLFDEFEKRFKDDRGAQEMLLSLFDGIDDGKKLYVITCNETHELNRYLLNRPGRFHYHFIIDKPNKEDIEEYLNDNLVDSAKNNIDAIVSISNTNNFTYDILRAIVFELNQGYDLTETLHDLNIERNSDVRVRASVTFSNGMVARLMDSKYVVWNLDSYRTQSMWLGINPDALPAEIPEQVRYEMRFLEIKVNTEDIYFENQKIKVKPETVRFEFNNNWLECDETTDEVRTMVRKFISTLSIESIDMQEFNGSIRGMFKKFY